jgi:hypothetical protein
MLFPSSLVEKPTLQQPFYALPSSLVEKPTLQESSSALVASSSVETNHIAHYSNLTSVFSSVASLLHIRVIDLFFGLFCLPHKMSYCKRISKLYYLCFLA